MKIQDLPRSISDKIITALEDAGIVFDESDCNATIKHLVRYASPFRYSGTISNICLQALGKATQRHLSWLEVQRLAGEGSCPKCGSNDVSYRFDFYCYQCGYSHINIFNLKNYETRTN